MQQSQQHASIEASSSTKSNEVAKSKHDLIKELLWPNKEKIEQFKNLAGAEPNSQLMFRSNKFYKIWCNRTKGTLTELDKFFLLASAIEAQKDYKVNVTFMRKDSGETAIVNRAGKKRKMAMEETGEMESEDLDDGIPITDENVHEHELVVKPISYAVAASSKVKNKSEYLIHVYGSKDRRLPVTREDFARIEQTIVDKNAEFLEGEGEECMCIDWMAYNAEAQVGLVAAEDESSMKKLKTIIDQLLIDGATFRGWDKEDLFINLSVKLPATLRDEARFTTEFISKAIRKQNPFLSSTEHFTPAETVVIKPQSQIPNMPSDFRVFRFKVDVNALDNIKQAGGKIHVIAAKLMVYKGREPVCSENNISV